MLSGALCTGRFTDSVHTRSGFGVLHLHASPKASDADQMFAIGYLEGWLTAERVYDHFHNMRAFFNMTTAEPVQWCVGGGRTRAHARQARHSSLSAARDRPAVGHGLQRIPWGHMTCQAPDGLPQTLQSMLSEGYIEHFAHP